MKMLYFVAIIYTYWKRLRSKGMLSNYFILSDYSSVYRTRFTQHRSYVAILHWNILFIKFLKIPTDNFINLNHMSTSIMVYDIYNIRQFSYEIESLPIIDHTQPLPVTNKNWRVSLESSLASYDNFFVASITFVGIDTALKIC